MPKRVLIRLLTHPLVLLLLFVVALRAGLFWHQRRPPTERSILIGAATVIDITVAGNWDRDYFLCAEGCYERYAIVIEHVGNRQAIWSDGGAPSFVDAEVSFLPPGPPAKARERLTMRFWMIDARRWHVERAGHSWGGCWGIVVSEDADLPGEIVTGFCNP